MKVVNTCLASKFIQMINKGQVEPSSNNQIVISKSDNRNE